MQNRMEIFSTTAKPFVWPLRLRVQKAQSPNYWHKTGKNLKSVNQYKYLGAVLDIEPSDDTDIQRQLRSKILCSKQAASLFSRCSNAVKNVLFRSFIRPCMHHNYGGISESHACKDCMWPIILDALYNLPWRASVSSHDLSSSMQHSYIEGCIKKKLCTCFSKDAESLILMQSDCLYSSLFFEQPHFTKPHFWQPHFPFVTECSNFAVFARLRVCMSQCIRTLPGLDQFKN